MNLLLNNLTNPSLLFFVLGILAVILKSDLEIPPTSVKFMALAVTFPFNLTLGMPIYWMIIQAT